MSLKHISAAWKAEVADPQAKLLLVRLADHANAEGTCWPQVEGIAADTGLNEATIYRKMKSLEDAGFLVREKFRHGSQNRVRYHLNFDNSSSQPASMNNDSTLAACEDENSGPPSHGASMKKDVTLAACESHPRSVRVSSSQRARSAIYKEPSHNRKRTPTARTQDLSDFDQEPEVKPLCTIEQAVSFGATIKISRAACEFWWHSRNAAGWMRSSASGHPRKITGWQSDLSTSRGWAEEEAHKTNQSPNGKSTKRELRGADISL